MRERRAPADIYGMSALRKPRLEIPAQRLPLLLVVNNELQGVRRRHPVLTLLKFALFAFIAFGVVNMMHGLAR